MLPQRKRTAAIAFSIAVFYGVLPQFIFCVPAQARFLGGGDTASGGESSSASSSSSHASNWLLTPVDSLFKSPMGSYATSGSAREERPQLDGSEGNLTVEDVKIEGNRLVPAEDILGVMKTKRGDHFDRDQVMQDLRAVNNMGYFDDRSLQAIPEMGGQGVMLKIRVQENAPVTGFAFQGNSVLSSGDLSKAFADQLGKPQNLTQLSGAIDKVEQAYHEKGFMLARVVDVKDDPDGNVGIKIDEGNISNIQIVGNKKTKDFIIRRAIKLKPGAVYNERELTADLRKLYGNGYFQDIRRSLVPDPNNPDKYTLKVEVDEKRTGSVGLGGGIDTMYGPFGSASFSDNNFRGTGQIASMRAQMGMGMFNGMANQLSNGGSQYLPTNAGAKMYNVSADWIEPNLFGSNTSLGISGFGQNYASMMVQSAMQQSIGATATFSRQLTPNMSGSLALGAQDTMMHAVGDSLVPAAGNVLPNLMQRAMQLGYAGDPSSAANFAEHIRQTQLKGGIYASATPTLYWNTTNNRFDPTSGAAVKLTGGPSLGITGSSFGKLGASVSKYYQVTPGTTLAMNIQGGTMLGGVPQFAMFRLGGFNGLRGYRQFSDLGTGTNMLMGSVELRRHLPLPKGDKHSVSGHMLGWVDKNVRWDAFFDYGGVTGNSLINNMYSQNMWGASVGLGLRVNVPMLGMIRLDYGCPLLSTATGHFIPRFTVGFGDKF
jgi:outer membrane protein insertion porin family